MTVMFCDVRNFTSMSEGMAPETLVQVMNRFLTPTTDAVLRHRGTVDKYIGDCLMAFWNAPLDDPDHASHACAAAREMLAQVDALGAELERTMGVPRLAVGVGLNSGPCLVGNLGSTQRFNYSVMGDTVNVASRLKSLTKTYRVPILAGDATRLLAPGLPWLVLDEVAVKGRSAPVRVHTLWLGDPGRHARLAELHELILAARLAGRGEEVAALVETAMARVRTGIRGDVSRARTAPQSPVRSIDSPRRIFSKESGDRGGNAPKFVATGQDHSRQDQRATGRP